MLQKLMEEINKAIIIGQSLGLRIDEAVQSVLEYKQYSRKECIHIAKEISKTDLGRVEAPLLYYLSVKAGYKLVIGEAYDNADTCLISSVKFNINKEDAIDYILENIEASIFVTNMHSLFSYYKRRSLDLRRLDTSNVRDMCDMFEHACIKNLDLSNLNTYNVEDMSCMFYNSNIMNLKLNLHNNTNLMDISCMFSNSEIDNLDLSEFDTSNVVTMYNTFSNAKIDILDLRSFSSDRLKITKNKEGLPFNRVCSKEIILRQKFLDKLSKNMNMTYSDTYNILFKDTNAKIIIV